MFNFLLLQVYGKDLGYGSCARLGLHNMIELVISFWNLELRGTVNVSRSIKILGMPYWSFGVYIDKKNTEGQDEGAS